MTIRIELPERLLSSKGEDITIRICRKTGQATVVEPQESQHQSATSGRMLSPFVESLIAELQANGKQRLQETYRLTLHRFLQFRDDCDINVADIDMACIMAFESYLQQQSLTLNTISFYMRVLRAIYNKAIDQLNIADKRPFARVFTGYAKTAKRAVAIETISLVAASVPTAESLRLARDLFLFSYYTRGMSFVDIAFLKKTDIHNGHLVYKRKKTGQQLRIAWRDSMQAIVDRHPSLDGIHLLGIIDSRQSEPLRRQYQKKQSLINYYLRRFSSQLNLDTPLTMYVARHSWATIAHERDIPMAVISDSLGHHSEKTTRIYLKSIDANIIDRANDEMIDAILPTND